MEEREIFAALPAAMPDHMGPLRFRIAVVLMIIRLACIGIAVHHAEDGDKTGGHGGEGKPPRLFS
jgi:hypothetical protein